MSPSRTGYAGGGYDPALVPLNDPNYVPPPPAEPGMYEPAYTGPGVYTAPPPAPVPTESGYTEPGMYAPPYQGPGQFAPRTTPVEPGMYEPNYVQPGYYAPRAASTYYGGQDDRPLFTGTERFATNDMTMSEGTRRDMVQLIDPHTGERTYRHVSTGGTVVNEGTSLPDSIDPGATGRGEVFGNMAGGGTAPRTGVAAVGPTSSQLGYRYQQGDPGVVETPRLIGTGSNLTRRSDLAPPTVDRLAGLFGGGERKTPQPMPLPPGSHRERVTPNRRRKRS